MNLIYKDNIKVAALSKKNKMRYWNGKVLKDPKILAYEKVLALAFSNYKGPVSNAQLAVNIVFCWNDRRRRDLQNALDVILDVAQGIIYADDSQIIEIVAKKVIGSQTSEIFIEIWET